MEGYSVTEAASILGVPTERVWELLARGVLSGAPEGETGMRVYLQPRPAPAPPVPEAARTNGDGGTREPERELSPFRELLTEFRNLTERYGQALLALGESRGEVASLRSRVDLLEARMDLRLPMGSAATSPASGWPAPATEVAAPAPIAPEEPHHDEEDEDRPRRRRGHRRATESFAEALARAEDPTKPELPGAAETAAAMAALRDEAAAEGEHAPEAVLPRELPAAEPMPLPEEPEARAGDSPAPEPDSEPRSAEAVADAVAEPEVAAQASVAEPEVEAPAIEAAVEDEAAAETQVTDELTSEPLEASEDTAPEATEPAGMGEPATEMESVTATPAEETSTADETQPFEAPPEEAPALEPAEVAASAEAEPEPEPEPEPIAWDPERYTVEIIEPDWYADDAAEPIAAAPLAAPAPETEPEPPPPSAPEPIEAGTAPSEAEPQPVSLPEAASAPLAPAAGPPLPAHASSEETMLWFGKAPDAATDEGADEIEVVGAAHRSGPAPMPGAQELDDALAALDALSQGQPSAPGPASDEGWRPAVGPDERPIDADAAPRSVPPQPAAEDQAGTTPTGLLPSVRPPATSASRAYRRLRRIFPG